MRFGLRSREAPIASWFYGAHDLPRVLVCVLSWGVRFFFVVVVFVCVCVCFFFRGGVRHMALFFRLSSMLVFVWLLAFVAVFPTRLVALCSGVLCVFLWRITGDHSK